MTDLNPPSDAAADDASAPHLEVMQASETAPRTRKPRPTRFRCVVCSKEKPASVCNQLDVVRPSLYDRIKAEYPDLPAEGYICNEDLDRFRSRYVTQLLGQERGELTKLEHDVVQKSRRPRDSG